MPYLDIGIYNHNPYHQHPFHKFDNNDEKVFKMAFEGNKNKDEDFSNKDEVYLMNSTKPKTNEYRQDKLNNLKNNKITNNDNDLIKEPSNNSINKNKVNNKNIINEGNKKEENKAIKKNIIEEEKKEDNKEKNDNQNENKINEEDKNAPKVKKKLFKAIQMPPTQNLIDDINKIFKMHSIYLKRKILQKNKDILDLQKNMSDDAILSKKKRKRNKSKENKEINIKNEKKPLGRKKKYDKNKNTEISHDKYSLDNISKKIKTIIYNGVLLIFINDVFNSFLTPDNKKLYLSKIKDEENEDEGSKDRILIKKLKIKEKKDENLNDLYMPIKDILSKINVNSPKKKDYPESDNKIVIDEINYNKIVIDEIIKNEKDNKIIMFILNDLTLGNFIDLFLYKKELKDFGKLDEEKINQINNILKRIDVLFEQKDSLKNEKINKLVNRIDILKNDNKYISKFLIILYNYERFLFIKQDREKKIMK